MKLSTGLHFTLPERIFPAGVGAKVGVGDGGAVTAGVGVAVASGWAQAIKSNAVSAKKNGHRMPLSVA